MPEPEHEHGHAHAQAEHGHEHGPGCGHDHGQADAEHGHVHGAGCGHNHEDSGHGHGHGHAHEEQRAAAADVPNGGAATQDMSPLAGMAPPNVLVLFGSQTGCAEEVRRFAPHAAGHHTPWWGAPHGPAAQQLIRDGPRPRPQVAKQVVEELTRQHVPSECLPLDEYDVTKLPLSP